MKRISDEEIINKLLSMNFSISLSGRMAEYIAVADAQLAMDKEEKQEILDMIEEVAGYTGFFQYLTSDQKKKWGIE